MSGFACSRETRRSRYAERAFGSQPRTGGWSRSMFGRAGLKFVRLPAGARCSIPATTGRHRPCPTSVNEPPPWYRRSARLRSAATYAAPSVPSPRGPPRLEALNWKTDAFARAWALLRDGNFRAAATAFGEAEVAARGSPLEEDALYWRAVATARLKDAQAATLFCTFLDRFPSSPRASDVRVALGWLRLKEGSRQAAERLFLDALPNASPQTTASAREGLRRTSN